MRKVEKGTLFNEVGHNQEVSAEESKSDSYNKALIRWEDVLKKLEERSNPQVFFWFSSLKLLDIENGAITLQAKTNFDKDWVENHYLDFIKETLAEIYRSEFEINLVSEQDDNKTKTQAYTTAE